MAAEAMRRPTGREEFGGTSFSAARADQEPIERVLRRLVDRVELVERRYGETIEELQGRLGQYSERADTLAAATSPEESDTLERLRRQLSSLADRLAQPKAPKPGAGGLESLNRALTEAAKETGGSVRVRPASPPKEGAGGFDFPPLFAERAKHQFAPIPEAADPAINGAELDRRLGEVASRLERSISEAIPVVAIQSLDRRMRELALRFDSALEQSPRLETLKHLEGQISGIEEQVARLEGHMSRIGLVEGELQSLLQQFEGTPAHLAEVAREAAKEAARLLAREGGDTAGAVERLDAIHRDLVAMKDRSDETGMRMVDTLAAVHDSLRALVRQLDRNGQGTASDAEAAPDGSKAELPIEGKRGPISFEHGSLGSASGREARQTEDERTTPGSAESSPAGNTETAEDGSEKPSIDDFVAAARRAAETAAIPESGALAALNALAAASGQESRRKRPSLAIWTAIVLALCAAFLYFRFEPQLPPLISPAATEQMPAVQTKTATGLKGQPSQLGQPGLPNTLTPPSSRSEPAAPIVPTAAPDAPEELPWRTETIPAEIQSLAVGQAVFPHRD